MGINLGQTPITAVYFGLTAVKSVFFGSEQAWGGEEPGPTGDWLCFTAVDAEATIRLNNNGGINASFMTSTDGQTWTDYTFWTVITLENVGDKVYFRAKDENTTAFYTGYRNYLQFQTTAGKRIAASGNIMTLLKADGSKTDITNDSQFRSLFQNCTSLTTAPELPAKTLKYSCYANMFEGCTSLSYIKVGFTEWRVGGIISTTDSWLNNVAATGTFICPATLDTSTRGPSSVPEGWNIVQPLTFVADQANTTFNLRTIGSPDAVSLEYSYDGETWDDYTWVGNSGKSLSLQAINDKVYLRAKTENATISKNDSSFYYFSLISGKYSVSGNILTLLKADGSRTDVPYYCYGQMFANCKTTTAPTLPATTLASNCYQEMFRDCPFLTSAPALPATTLAGSCYRDMFKGCSSLATAPTTLPATTLATYCYASMFQDCSSLTTAPELPATTLASNCYLSMFLNCSSLMTAPATLSATTIATFCCSSMFQNCTSLSTAPAELPAMTLIQGCYLNMFNNCSSLTTAPVLPATTPTHACYLSMFKGCSTLSSVEVGLTSWTGGINPTLNWLSGVAASGTFTCPAELSDIRGVNNIPEDWTKVDAT